MRKSPGSRLLTALLTLTMLLCIHPATLAESDTFHSETPMEVTLLYSDNATFPFNPEWISLQEIQKRTNVTIKPIIVPNSDYGDKMKLVLNSNDIPDFLSMAEGIDPQFGLNGILLPISDYMDQLPFFRAAIEKAGVESEIENEKLADGKLYYMPGIRVEVPLYDGLAVRVDLLEKYGMDKPTTMDELYDFLLKYKEENPQSVPLTGRWSADAFFSFHAPVYGILNGSWTAPNGVYYDWYTNQYECTYTSERYKQMIMDLARFYEAGLLDPEAFSQSTDQWKAKLSTGISIAAHMWNGNDADIMAISPEYDIQMLPPLNAIEGIIGTTEPYSHLKHGWAMPAKAVNDPNFEKKLAFMDWMIHSEESTVLGHWGVEGVTFHYDEEGNKYWDDKIANAPGGAGGVTQPEYGLCINSLNPSTPEDYELSISLPYMLEVSAFVKENDLFGKVGPKAKFDADETEDLNLMVVPLLDYCTKREQEFIFGRADIEAEWDAFVQEVLRRGGQKIADMHNAKIAE